jgi:hypothetical protein
MTTAIIKDITIGGQRLILGDCQEVMRELGRFDTLVSDPPYEIQTTGGGIHSKRTFLKDVKKAKINKGFNYNIIDAELYGSAIIFCHNDQLVKLLPSLSSKYKRYVFSLSWSCTYMLGIRVTIRKGNLAIRKEYLHTLLVSQSMTTPL